MVSKLHSVSLVNGCWTFFCVVSSNERWYSVNSVVRTVFGLRVLPGFLKNFSRSDRRTYNVLLGEKKYVPRVFLSKSTMFLRENALESFLVRKILQFLGNDIQFAVQREAIIRLLSLSRYPLLSRDKRPVSRISPENSLLAGIYIWVYNVICRKYDIEYIRFLVQNDTSDIGNHDDNAAIGDRKDINAFEDQVTFINKKLKLDEHCISTEVHENVLSYGDVVPRVLDMPNLDDVYSHMLMEMESTFILKKTCDQLLRKRLYGLLEKQLLETTQTVVVASYSICGDVEVEYKIRNCLEAVYDRVRQNVLSNKINLQRAVESNNAIYFDSIVEEALTAAKLNLPWQIAIDVLSEVHNGFIQYVHRVPVTTLYGYEDLSQEEKRFLNEEAIFRSKQRYQSTVEREKNGKDDFLYPVQVYLDAFLECIINAEERCGFIYWPSKQLDVQGNGPNGRSWVHLDQQNIRFIDRLYRGPLKFRNLQIIGRTEEIMCKSVFNDMLHAFDRVDCLHQKSAQRGRSPRWSCLLRAIRGVRDIKAAI